MATISIVLPVYKQSKQVDQLLNIYGAIQEEYPKVVEVIFVVNNGDQETLSAFESVQDEFFKVEFLTEGGWGAGITHGVQKAQGEWILYTNSARTHLDELRRFINAFQPGQGKAWKAKRQTRGVFRKLLSVLFQTEFALFSGHYQTDVNGTPKLLEKTSLIEMNIQDSGVFYDAELTFKWRSKNRIFTDVPFYNYTRLEGKSTTNSKMAFSFLVQLPKKLRAWKRESLQ